MIVSEERFAGGFVDDSGETVAYDDLGELLAAAEARPELRARAWVRDFRSGEWLRLADAKLVLVESLATPMGTGWVAFARAADAESFARSRRGR